MRGLVKTRNARRKTVRRKSRKRLSAVPLLVLSLCVPQPAPRESRAATAPPRKAQSSCCRLRCRPGCGRRHEENRAPLALYWPLWYWVCVCRSQPRGHRALPRQARAKANRQLNMQHRRRQSALFAPSRTRMGRGRRWHGSERRAAQSVFRVAEGPWRGRRRTTPVPGAAVSSTAAATVPAKHAVGLRRS